MRIFSRYFWNDIYRNIKNIPYNIKTVLSIIPVVWNNFDWDYCFLLYLMLWKLKRMEAFFSDPKMTHIVDAPKVANQIKQCIDEIKMFMEDTGGWVPELQEEYNEFEKIAGKWMNNFENQIPVWMPKPKHNEWIMWFEKATSFQHNDELKEKSRKLHKGNYELQQKAFKRAFARMGNHMQTWWD